MICPQVNAAVEQQSLRCKHDPKARQLSTRTQSSADGAELKDGNEFLAIRSSLIYICFCVLVYLKNLASLHFLGTTRPPLPFKHPLFLSS